jgi:hypothetical protein
MPISAEPKIYHIVHVDRLPSIIADGFLWCDAEAVQRLPPGTTIGMKNIKQRRLTNRLISRPGLRVGDCVPFYFCPRSVMLYILHMDNLPELSYHGGQEPIVHLEADLRKTVAWAEKHGRRWAFTLSNAGATYFEDRCDLARLGEIDWSAVQATDWRRRKEGKQAEFLVEHQFPWKLISRIGVHSHPVYRRAKGALEAATHKPPVAIKRNWYY